MDSQRTTLLEPSRSQSMSRPYEKGMFSKHVPTSDLRAGLNEQVSITSEII